jgi:thiamine biosynthesis lipoprotein
LAGTELLRREFRAMGTEIALTCPDTPGANRRMELAERWTHAYEGRLSRFMPYSELSRLNALAGRPFRASPLLFKFVLVNLCLAQRSGGIFDPTILSEIEAAGYDRTFDLIPKLVRRRVGANAGSYRDIELDLESRTITLPRGLGIDSGGLGKGWAADRLALALGPDCLVDCGGDIAAAGRPQDAEAWYIGVQDPFAPEHDLALIGVRGQGVATSSTLKRRWRTDRGEAHHLIDPRSGLPSTSDIAALTVVATNARMADFHAKVALIQGSSRGLAYLEAEPGVEGLALMHDRRHLTTSGWGAYLVAPL